VLHNSAILKVGLLFNLGQFFVIWSAQSCTVGKRSSVWRNRHANSWSPRRINSLNYEGLHPQKLTRWTYF